VFGLAKWIRNIMKFSQVISRVRWFSFVETNVSKTISVLVLRVIEIIIRMDQKPYNSAIKPMEMMQ
jgi:hypothetical protein